MINFVASFGQNHFLWVIDYLVPLAQVDHLTQYIFNCIAWHISFNPNITFQIKVLEYWSFDKRLPSLGKSLYNVGN